MRADAEMIRLHAKKLKMPTVCEYESALRDAEAGNWGYEQFLLTLLKAEVEQRDVNQRQRRLKAARFPQLKTLDEFDFGWLNHVSKATVCELATGRFIDEKRPVIACGNPGTGKTHLALAIAYHVCSHGYKVRFYTAAQLTNDLAEASQQGTLGKLQQRLMGYNLLVIDELSYLTFNRATAELFFQAISNRHELGSVFITTNLPFSRWTEIFGDETLTGALVDRLAHNAVILNMNGDSYRLKER